MEEDSTRVHHDHLYAIRPGCATGWLVIYQDRVQAVRLLNELGSLNWDRVQAVWLCNRAG